VSACAFVGRMRETLSEGLESFDDSSVAVTSTSKLALLDGRKGHGRRRRKRRSEQEQEWDHKECTHRHHSQLLGAADVVQDYLGRPELMNGNKWCVLAPSVELYHQHLFDCDK
jgi:hypothetical protein